ncbi:MAG: class flavin-dependent oxidoreductase [Nocardioidaceae bacterium]|nr:class flavin-dependent oxidoreductase [Nocardioidaceae bacterium]
MVVLVGAAGSGKSSWAHQHYGVGEVVSSDALRAVVGTGPADLDASTDAFAVLDQIITARTARGLTTVVDTLGLDPTRRRSWLDRAQTCGLPAIAVVIATEPRLCRERNAQRDRPVPAPVLTQQLSRMRAVTAELGAEGWDRIVVVDQSAATGDATTAPGPVSPPPAERTGLRFVLQLSRFGFGDDPAGWLRSMALSADQVGFAGIAVMDHLIQIPQVGRAWDPILEPWVTLGLLAGLDTQLTLGTLVSPVTFRHPGIIAKTVATLDVVSGGRAFCGLGAGWWGREHAAYGMPLPPASERLDQLERCIETMRALWAPGTKAYAGAHVQLPETTCYPRPIGQIPIIVGGNGERRTLKIAAAQADGCNLPSDPDTLRHRITVLHRHCAAVGRDPAEVEITVLDLPILGADRDDVARRVERLRGRTSATVFAARHHAGTADLQVERYRRLAALGVRTVFVAPQDLDGPADLDAWASILAAV